MMMKPPTLIPAEWAQQRAIWTAWPANQDEWNGDLVSPRTDVAAMVHALAPTNKVRVLVNGEDALKTAKEKIGNVAELIPAKYGDIWLRDTGPIFAKSGAGQIALRFKTNSWGGKYDLPDDATVGDAIAKFADKPASHFDFVLEGGAVDHDGQGTVLTTAQTVLNPNRNGWTKAQAETELSKALGAQHIIWIDEGLFNDHTDGHIDNIARFVAPGRVVCQAPVGKDDPNADTLNHIAATLEKSVDATGRKLDVIRIPSPGLYHDKLGAISPASHMNFIIGNGVVVVPVYGTQTEAAALEELQKVFPNRKVVGVSSKGLLGSDGSGGGSFHCITQQEPA